MKLIQTTLAAALTAGGLFAAVPAANAQQLTPAHFRHGQMSMPHDGMMPGRGADLLRMACSAQGGERLEAALNAAAGRLDLTDEQTPLFEDFRTAALSAQTAFADECVAATQEAPADIVDGIRARQTLLTAQVAAIDSALPAFEAFYDSLTDRQKLQLVAMRAEGRHRWEDRMQRPGRHFFYFGR